MAQPFDHSYCPDCDVVIPYRHIEAHQRHLHPDRWLSLNWQKPLEFPPPEDPSIADQLDAAAPDL